MIIPLNLNSSGAIPTPANELLFLLLDNVLINNPGFTASLPGSLLEDISSTDVGAIAMIDQARVDAVNNLTPYLANPFVLAQLGAMAGIPQGILSNGSAYVLFTGTVGLILPAGFLISDGTNQYAVQSPGAVIASNGQSSLTYVVMTVFNTAAIPANTITNVISSLQAGITLSVTNPNAGMTGLTAETVQAYRARVINAQTSVVQGVAAYIKSLVMAVPGVNPRLVSVLSAAGGWEVICGGGDPYQVAGAIYQGSMDLSSIVGSIIPSRNITVTILDNPDSYQVTYVNPPQQNVTVNCIWNTNLINFSSSIQVNQLSAIALNSYINSIVVGQPINLLEMISVFQTSVIGILATNNISSLVFAVYINGILVNPNAGTSIINGDPESYFTASANAITVSQ